MTTNPSSAISTGTRRPCRRPDPRAIRCGFTLIELLVVFAVVGILVGMAMPAIAASRESARRAACGSNQRRIVMEMLIHKTETGAWPSAANGAAAQRLVYGRLGSDAQPFVCPSDAGAQASRKWLQDNAVWTAGSAGYAFDIGPVPVLAKPGRVVLGDRLGPNATTPHIKITMAAFADGHVATINKAGMAFPNPTAGDPNIYAGTSSDADTVLSP